MKAQSKGRPDPDRAGSVDVQTSSPRYSLPPKKSSEASSGRKIAIAVDLSEESAFAVEWAVQNYLRAGDAVTMLHVRPTSILYGADWGSTHFSEEDDFDRLTAAKVGELARPLADARVPFKVQIVKDHDMKERLCLEIERLGLSAVIMGSRGFGASRRPSKTRRLGSVSDYCVRRCVCPVVVVRHDAAPAPAHHLQEDQEYHDAVAEGDLHEE